MTTETDGHEVAELALPADALLGYYEGKYYLRVNPETLEKLRDQQDPDHGEPQI